MGQQLSPGFWAAPVAWCALLAAAFRLDRLDGPTTLTAAAVVLLGVAGTRGVAGSRGGVAGRVADTILVATAVGVLVAEPASHRTVVALTGAVAAGSLATVAVWRAARTLVQARMTVLVGAAVGALLAPGMVGADLAPGKIGFVALAAAATGGLLAAVVAPWMAALAVLALGVAIGPGHASAWLLPVVVAGSLWALQERRGTLAATFAVAAAALPPAGLAVTAGILAAAARRHRSPFLLAWLAPALLLAWWRLPADIPLMHPPTGDLLLHVLPVTPTAMPFLLPLLVLGLASRSMPPAEGRDGLAVALLALPVVGGGPWSAAAGASIWLLALPAAAASARLRTAAIATTPWSLGASCALLLLGPWGGADLVPWQMPWLTAGWAAAVVLSLVPHRAARLAWILPAAGLVWTFPVEGSDRALAPGQQLALSAPASGEWVFMLGWRDGGHTAPDEPVLAADADRISPLRAGRDCPLPEHPASHRIVVPGRSGRATERGLRAISRRRTDGDLVLRAAARVVVRIEDGAPWRRRRTRVVGLLGGALAVLLLAHLVRGTASFPLGMATVILVGGAVAAGSSVAPLARTAVLGAADIAAAVMVSVWASLLPVLRRRRLVAGALLLVPLALAQPLLRPPAGDEVYHLQLLESLRDDHDLAVANNLDPTRPAEAAYARHGNTLIHSPTLALVTLPGYMLLGHAGALAVIALLVAVGAALAARRARQLGASERTVLTAWLAVVATYPALTFATQLWPAGAGILVVGVLLVAAAGHAPVAAALTAAAAVLVKVRLGLVALPVAVAGALSRRRSSLLLVVGACAAALAGVAALLGGPLGRHRLQALLPDSGWHPVVAVWGLMWDAAGGLAFTAPLWLVAAIWVGQVWRRGGGGERGLVIGAGLTVLALAVHEQGEWYGGGSPPARYLVPLLPLVLLATAEAVRSTRGRRWLRLVTPWAAVSAWVAVTRPLWLYNPVDGGSWLADQLARSLRLATRDLLPTLLRPAPAAVVVPLVMVAVGLWWTARARRGAPAMVIAGLLTVVAVAAARTEARVHAEDPQIWHRGGLADPPSGTLKRASHRIAWRLHAGDEIVIPWRAPFGRTLAAVVRIADADGDGQLLASWDRTPAVARRVDDREWHSVQLPAPASLGRSWLRLRWETDTGSDLLVDRVQAVRQPTAPPSGGEGS